MSLVNPAATPPTAQQRSLFRIEFRGGKTVTVSAQNSLKAEAKARRTEPGVVKSVRFLRRATQ